MKLTYDPTTDSLYVQLGVGTSSESEEIEDGVILDFDDAGRVVGIDIQHASEHLDLTRLESEGIPVAS